MIVSASRRTDLPALHHKWLARRLEEGYAVARNPFNPAQEKRVDLRPAPAGELEALVLWTRDPSPVLPLIPGWEERGIRTLYLVTLTGYPPALEAASPPADSVATALKALAAVVGPKRIRWRYDPIFTSRALGLDAAFHRENFASLLERLRPLVDRVIVSIYDDYAKSRRRLQAEGTDFDQEEAAAAAVEIANLAAEAGLELRSCSEELAHLGIRPGGCIDRRWLEDALGVSGPSARDKGQRKGCLCAPSVDIGAYDTCTHGCVYCYATTRPVATTPEGDSLK